MHAGFEINSDHKGVILNMKLDWRKMKNKFMENSVKVKIEKTSNEEKVKEHKAEVEA